MDKNSPSFGLKITTLVVPATNYINNEDVEKIKELIQDSVFYLESMTECRYYPVPTIILDEIPPKDRERYGDKEECDSDNEKPDLNSLGVYFHPGSHPSTDFKNKLEQFGYEDIFIESLFAGGVVAVAYDRSIEYLRIKHEGFKKNWDKNKKLIYMWDRDIEKLNKCREELEDFREFF
ncbi:MAG TPA: hypothetical protein PK467_06405, partial [Candidatus Wallbacteria bacterium]|nr:hypothetical protein [Candidatus Wallbacteria bacterium]